MRRAQQGGSGLVREFSPAYYGLCAAGGMLSAGTTHLAITPLDVLKVNMQATGSNPVISSPANPIKYNSILSGFSTLLKEQGPSSLWRGWSGKLFGYGVQGVYVFFLSSASAQVFADVALCPFEAVKVRVQTQPTFAKGLADGFPKLYKAEGLTGFYRGLIPLWGRNLPFSMVMFTTFEQSVDLIYSNVIQRRKEDCSRSQQLGVTCLAGYAAGAVGTVISNPADNVVTSLYNKKAENVLQAVKNIGLANLFTRSLPIRIAIVGPVVTLQWFFYDSIKVLSGLPTTGGIRRHQEATDLLA
ncbi:MITOCHONDRIAL PHOSPHATE CARRIER PROTEIN 1 MITOCHONDRIAL [Salix viminalis]|uniref:MITOCHONDRIAL PHOSPHATE CARRIER PROTEIN 1 MITOCHONDRIAL n=1 Tax=Salix viminalis TaxID=40686 RepID=A0A9Q0TC52_SALVM|nr:MITOCHONDRIAL PHOSPHATE CARRIER PROTEIN 1 MITOCHONDRIAL [Salix viminalis]